MRAWRTWRFPSVFLESTNDLLARIILAGGVGLAIAALLWPASIFRVAQHKTRLDDIMPEYQFFEKHSARIHARPEQVMAGRSPVDVRRHEIL